MATTATLEHARLSALERYAVLDTPPEAAFDRIAALAAQFFRAPVALVSLVGARHVSFKACFGVDLRQQDRSLSFCTHALHSQEVLVVPDLAADERFTLHPLVTGAPHLRFYAGAPLVAPGGHTLGTLCVLDHRPRADLSAQERAVLGDLAALVVDELELRLRTQEAGREAQMREAQARTLQDALGLSQLLQGIGDLSDLGLSPAELLPHVVELTAAALDVDWGGLAAIEGDRATLLSTWHTPAGADLGGLVSGAPERGQGGLLWQAAGRDAPLLISDDAREPGGRADLRAAGVRAAAGLSLGRVGAVGYVMTFARRERRPWSPRDRHLIEAVARAARQALTQSAGREALRGSEARLHLALEAAPVILWTADMTGTFTLSQGRGLAGLEANPGSMVGQSVREVYAGHPAILANVDRALRGERFVDEVTVGGRVFEASYAPLRDETGRQVGVIGTGYDVTETVRARREAERAREQAEALLSLAHLPGTGANVQDLAGEALRAVGRALGGGALVLWQRAGEALHPFATHGEVPPAAARLTHDLLWAGNAPWGVLAGEPVFLARGEVPGSAARAGVREMALLPVNLDVPERAWVLGVFRTGGGAWSPFERDLLAAAARTLWAGVERQRHLRTLEVAARTDTLTGLGNRRAFELDLDEELNRARRQGTPVGLLSLDLDGLKAVNDTHGHARGDALLREFARALRRCLRGEDRLHRLGGDEYVVLLPGVGCPQAPVILERVQAAVDDTRAAGFAGVDVSAGLACFPAEAESGADLVRLSDVRMYEAKAGKRAREEVAAG